MKKLINNQANVISKERNYWLDNAKFFLILLVVVGHFIEGFIGNEIIREIYCFIYLFHMPLFIFITGFFSKNTKNTKSRVIGFLVLFLIMQIIELIITKKRFTLVNPCFAIWYLQAIAVYNLIIPIIDKSKPIIALTISIIIGLVIGFDNYATTIGSLSRIFVMLPFFVLGYFAKEKDINKLKDKKAIIFSVIFLAILIISMPTITSQIKKLPELLWAKVPYQRMDVGNLGVFYRGAWYIISFITSFSILSIIPKRKIKYISEFGTRTLQVYCLHIIIYLIFKDTYVYEKINTSTEYYCLIPLSIILTIVLSLKVFSYPFDLIMRKKKSIYNKKTKRRISDEENKIIEIQDKKYRKENKGKSKIEEKNKNMQKDI